MTSSLAVRQFASMDFKNLSEAELEVIIQVVQRDFELKAAEKARLRRHRRHLKDADERVSILSSSTFNDNFCVICFRRFFILFFPKRSCFSCRHNMCKNCSVFVATPKVYICVLCQKERTLKSMSCDWYYGLLRNRFQLDASEVVARSLYTNQGQYSFVHIFYRKICILFKPEWLRNMDEQQPKPIDSMNVELLQKVKGAQISQYRQKIQTKWEEMEERLTRLELSDIGKSKRDEAFKYLVNEYKNQFKDILKEFSQVLYITLENYSAKSENPLLNLTEQVMNTVHEEVELLIGYKINCMPDEVASVVSDIESTAGVLIGNQMEDKLADALVFKICQGQKQNDFGKFDMDDLDIMRGDQSSHSDYIYRARPVRLEFADITRSDGSTLSVSSQNCFEESIEITENLACQLQTSSSSTFVSTPDSESDSISKDSQCEEVAISAEQVQHILKFPTTEKSSLVERSISVPVGEPITLQMELNGIINMNVIWMKASVGKREILKNSSNIEIRNWSNDSSLTSNLKVWDSRVNDGGIYMAYVANKPIAAFAVKIIENHNKLEPPSFVLRMHSTTCRTGQNSEFAVETNGYPEPRVCFFKNERQIDFTDKKYIFEYKSHTNRHILKILNIIPQDEGQYKCVASNSSGSCECSAQLAVINIKFRFDEKVSNRKSSSSMSSIEDDTFLREQARLMKEEDGKNSFPSLNQLMQIHDHLTYLEWQLDWFEEQNFKGADISQNSVNGADAYPPDVNSDTVIGREVPDEIRTFRHQISSYAASRSSDDEIDPALYTPQSAREMVIKSSSLNRPSQSQTVSKLREKFEVPYDSQYMKRISSITNRAPTNDSKKIGTSFSREIRVKSAESLGN